MKIAAETEDFQRLRQIFGELAGKGGRVIPQRIETLRRILIAEE